ncbi:MAG: PKD domain-containing protein, partial [Gemmatimonadota bacterium]
CAYHGHFTWNSPQGPKEVIFAAQPWVQQYPTGCSINSTPPNGDAAADRVISVVAHEVEESTTDYLLNAWYDASGQENADKCAYMYGTTYNNGTGVANMKIGAKDFLIQMNWVNSGNGGCLQGLSGGSNQPPVAAFTSNCTSGRLCSFDGTGSTDDVGITAYAWKLVSSGATVSTSPSFNKQFNNNITFDLMLTVTDGGGLSNSVTHTVMVTGGGGGNQPPVANFVATNCVAATHTCTLDGSSSTDDVGVVSWAWQRGNGAALGSGVTLSQSFPKAGTFPITLTVTDGGSLTGAVTKNIVVP